MCPKCSPPLTRARARALLLWCMYARARSHTHNTHTHTHNWSKEVTDGVSRPLEEVSLRAAAHDRIRPLQPVSLLPFSCLFASLSFLPLSCLMLSCLVLSSLVSFLQSSSLPHSFSTHLSDASGSRFKAWGERVREMREGGFCR
jgi:hypothetical protein